MPAPTNKLKHHRLVSQFAATVGHQPMMIDTVGPLTKIFLRLKYTYTPDGAANATGAVFQQNAAFLKNMTMTIQGKDTVWNISPNIYAARRAYENRGRPMRGMTTAINGTAGAAATAVDVVFPFHFDLVNGRKRDDAAIDLRGLSTCQMSVDFGALDASDLWATTVKGAISAVSASVEAEYIVNATSKDSYLARCLDEIQVPIAATNNNFAFDVDAKTGLVFRTLPLFFLTNRQGDDTLCAESGGQIDLYSGTTHFITTEPGFLKGDVADEFGIAKTDEIAGVDFVDLMQYGQLASCLPTAGLDSNLKYALRVTFGAGPSEVICQREYLRPLQAA